MSQDKIAKIAWAAILLSACISWTAYACGKRESIPPQTVISSLAL